MDRRRRGERGSTLMLMPAAVLIMVVLGAIAVDSAIAFLGAREAANAAAAAANDAAGAAYGVDAFYGGEGFRIDPTRASQVVAASMAARQSDFLSGVTWDVEVSPAGDSVQVTVQGQISYIFARALPGGAATATVRATSTATPLDG